MFTQKEIDTNSFRTMVIRLSHVVEHMALDPISGCQDAIQLLDDLYTLLPQQSVAELTNDVRTLLSGVLASTTDHDQLVLIVDASGDKVQVLTTDTLRAKFLSPNNVYPRYDLPLVFPPGGIPASCSRITFQRMKTAFDTDEDFLVKPRWLSSFWASDDQFVDINYKQFKNLPPRAVVRVKNDCDSYVLAQRIRSDQWKICGYSDVFTDEQAWDHLCVHAVGEVGYLRCALPQTMPTSAD